MDRYLDPNYIETGFGADGFGGGVIALGALALLFILKDGRFIVRIFVYVFSIIFILFPLLLKPSALSPWWFLVFAVATITDIWENKRSKKPEGLPHKTFSNVAPVSLKGATNNKVESRPSDMKISLMDGDSHNFQVMSYYSSSTIINCSHCKQAHSVSPREREFNCLKCGKKMARHS